MKNNLPFILANWKLNGGADLIRESITSMTAISNKKFNVRIGIAPPNVYVGAMVKCLKDSSIMIGSQNVSKFDSGAYTGETSAQMLKEVGCDFCIIGHSERRQVFLENNAACRTKIQSALTADIIPILCIGENSQQYELGLTKDILYRQLHESLNSIKLDGKEICIAYEPVWAIGTGKAATPELVQTIHAYIYDELCAIFDEVTAKKISILYGGSVSKNNAAQLLAMPNIDGLLVGGASLDPKHFSEICELASGTAI